MIEQNDEWAVQPARYIAPMSHDPLVSLPGTRQLQIRPVPVDTWPHRQLHPAPGHDRFELDKSGLLVDTAPVGKSIDQLEAM